MNEVPEYVSLPRLKWPTSGWWFTVLGTLVGVVALFAPADQPIPLESRIGILVLLAVLPAACVLGWFALLVVVKLCTRAAHYSRLRDHISRQAGELERAHETVHMLLHERPYAKSVRIDYCYRYRNDAFITLIRRRGFRLEVGDLLVVVEGGTILGRFTVTSDDGQRYHAKGEPGVDPVWLGHIVQAGPTHSAPPPEALAFKVTIGEESHE